MTALAADRLTDTKLPGFFSYPVAASTTIYAGALVCLNTDGYAVPAAATANFKVVGIARAQANNASGSAGDLRVLVDAPVIAKLGATSLAQAQVGETMYVVDDQTVDETATTQVTVGTLVEYISATQGWVLINPT